MPTGTDPNQLPPADDFLGGSPTILGRPAGAPGGPRPQAIVRRDLYRASAVFDAAGVAVIAFNPAPLDAALLVEHIALATTSGLATEARVYVGDPVPANLLDSTPGGNLDSADYPAGLYLPGGSVLRIRWTNGTAGAEAFATAQVAEVR